MTQHTELISTLRDIGLSHAIQAADALQAQALEIEGLRKDAMRWRWATGQAEFFSMVVDGTGLHCSEVSEAESAIDAAIAEQGGA